FTLQGACADPQISSCPNVVPEFVWFGRLQDNPFLPATLNVIPGTVVGSGSVTATWNNVTNPSTSDWIGVFHAGAADTAYLDFRWTSSCTKTPGATPQAAGSCSIPMPATVGTYELRLFSNSS